MKDVPDSGTQANAFQLLGGDKSFAVICSSPQEKQVTSVVVSMGMFSNAIRNGWMICARVWVEKTVVTMKWRRCGHLIWTHRTVSNAKAASQVIACCQRVSCLC